jgi:hypothetical protein
VVLSVSSSTGARHQPGFPPEAQCSGTLTRALPFADQSLSLQRALTRTRGHARRESAPDRHRCPLRALARAEHVRGSRARRSAAPASGLVGLSATELSQLRALRPSVTLTESDRGWQPRVLLVAGSTITSSETSSETSPDPGASSHADPASPANHAGAGSRAAPPKRHAPGWISEPVAVDVFRPAYTWWLWPEMREGLQIAARALGTDTTSVWSDAYKALSKKDPRVPNPSQVLSWARRTETSPRELFAQAQASVQDAAPPDGQSPAARKVLSTGYWGRKGD